jgi:hypothetical protein
MYRPCVGCPQQIAAANTLLPPVIGSSYIIVGGTYASMLYAYRVLHQPGFTGTVHHLFEGNDLYAGLPHADAVDFPSTVLGNTNLFICNGVDLVSSVDINIEEELIQTKTYHLLTPVGLGADIMTVYEFEIPPIFDSDPGPQRPVVVATSSPLTAAEQRIVNSLSSPFELLHICGLHITQSAALGNTSPVILNRHLNYKGVLSGGSMGRYIGRDVYDDNNLHQCHGSSAGPCYSKVPNVTGLRFQKVDAPNGENNSNYYTVTYRSNSSTMAGIVTLTGHVVFRMNPYDSLRIATQGGIEDIRNVSVKHSRDAPLSLLIPAEYRAVFAIPRDSADGIVNGNVGTHISMTLPEVEPNAPNTGSNTNINTTVAWIVNAYTVDHDAKTGNHGGTGTTLLVIEGTSINNRRRTKWLTTSYQFNVQRTNNEYRYINQFELIVLKILCAYGVGLPTTIDLCHEHNHPSTRICYYTEEQCTPSAVCYSFAHISDTNPYMNANFWFLDLVTTLYGTGIYRII